MPTHEAIIAEIDRDFFDSIGNWAGDAVWEFGPVWFVNRMAALSLPPGINQKQMSLSYPHLKVGPGASNFLAYIAAAGEQLLPVTLTWQLTDGTHIFNGQHLLEPVNGWTPLQEVIDLPGNFKRALAVLSFTVDEQDHPATDLMALRNLTLYHVTKVSYLPMTGVG